MVTPLKFWFNTDATPAFPGAFIATRSPDTVLREKLLDYVATPPLVGIIMDYVAPALPALAYSDERPDTAVLACPGPPFRLENRDTLVTERDALVCAEIARLLTIQESVSADTSVTMQSYPHIVGVETSCALDVPKMLIADYNGSQIRRLLIKPAKYKPYYAFALWFNWDAIIAAGKLVAEHCHPHGIMVLDFRPSRFIVYCSDDWPVSKTVFTVLSQRYMLLTTDEDQRPKYGDDMKYYSAWEVIRKGDSAITSASDVYAFGLLLFVATIGDRPWVLSSPRQMDEIAEALSKTEPGEVPLSPFGAMGGACLPTDSTAIYHLIDQCLSPRPEDRPTMAHVLPRLARLLGRDSGSDIASDLDNSWTERLKKLRIRWIEFEKSHMAKNEGNAPPASLTRQDGPTWSKPAQQK